MAVQRGAAEAVSASTVRCWLYQDALKPWQCRCWIFITDPGFRPKAARVVDLYSRTWQGRALGEGEGVNSADEKGPHPGTLPLPPQPDEMASKT